MALRLKGKHPAYGQPDRRYYMIDVQVCNRRVRLSSGTRDKALALRRQQHVAASLRHDPQISHAALRTLVRGHTARARDAVRRMAESGDDQTQQAAIAGDERFWACLS